MKVILLEDVYKQGVAGEVVDVAPGFARNYLIPRSMAVKASAGMLKHFENLRQQADVRRAERTKEFSAVAEKIEGLALYYPVKAGESGKLYGSVTSSMIVESLMEQIGLEIDPRRIGDKALRELGSFEVPIRLDSHLVPTVTVVIHREGEDPQVMLDEMASEAEETEYYYEDAVEIEETFDDAGEVIDEGEAGSELEEETE